MKIRWRILPLLLICCAPASAGPAAEGKREVMAELGWADLDLGVLTPFDLGSADGPRASASIGWQRTNIIQLGIHVTIMDLESDFDETIDGLSYGGFLGLRWPTRGKVSPFATIGFSIPEGNLGARYKASWDLAAGLKFYPSSRYGLSVTFRHQNYLGEDFVPAGELSSLNAGFLYRF